MLQHRQAQCEQNRVHVNGGELIYDRTVCWFMIVWEGADMVLPIEIHWLLWHFCCWLLQHLRRMTQAIPESPTESD